MISDLSQLFSFVLAAHFSELERSERGSQIRRSGLARDKSNPPPGSADASRATTKYELRLQGYDYSRLRQLQRYDDSRATVTDSNCKLKKNECLYTMVHCARFGGNCSSRISNREPRAFFNAFVNAHQINLETAGAHFAKKSLSRSRLVRSSLFRGSARSQSFVTGFGPLRRGVEPAIMAVDALGISLSGVNGRLFSLAFAMTLVSPCEVPILQNVCA